MKWYWDRYIRHKYYEKTDMSPDISWKDEQFIHSKSQITYVYRIIIQISDKCHTIYILLNTIKCLLWYDSFNMQIYRPNIRQFSDNFWDKFQANIRQFSDKSQTTFETNSRQILRQIFHKILNISKSKGLSQVLANSQTDILQYLKHIPDESQKTSSILQSNLRQVWDKSQASLTPISGRFQTISDNSQR